MKKRKDPNSKRKRAPGSRSRAAGQTLTTYQVGAMPILERFIRRARLTQILEDYVVVDKRATLSPIAGTLVLLRNYLVSREPIYGVGEWAQLHLPSELGLTATQVQSLNDDRVGRCLDRLYEADCPGLVLAITQEVIKEFELDLSEFHNDSTTVTFSGSYEEPPGEFDLLGKLPPTITWGKNKDFKPHLKQLLYNLTVTSDGNVPVVFGVENGNVTDDTTHKANWDFLCKIVGSSDFMYVADSKLATRENMSHIANRGGRFISVLPRTRAEHKEFQGFVLQGAVRWKKLFDKTNKDGEVLDVVSTVKSPAMSADGFRLLWFHSTRKTELDRTARAGRIRRAFAALSALNVKLKSPKTRFRDEERVRKAVHKCLADAGATEWVTVTIVSEEEEKLVQTRPGRPGPKTSYRRKTRKRFSITYHENYEKLDEALQLDGMFPLVTNDRELSVKEIYDTYKKQSHVEKRFSQLKTQFRVAPVYLKSSRRVVALLTIYYLAMLVQSLIEREIRRNMEADGIEAVALYPEERDCKAPTTRRIMDLFETIQLHELKPGPGQPPVRFVTDLSQIQREILRLLRVPDTRYKA